MTTPGATTPVITPSLVPAWAMVQLSRPSDRRWASWTCSTCDGRVTEWHPDAGAHPVDREEGHAAGCVRFAADVAAYERVAGLL